MLRLQEQGKLSAMKIKWWKEKRGGGACDVSATLSNRRQFVIMSFLFYSTSQSSGNDDGAEHLDMANVGGVFFVLLSGCGIAIFYGLCEWYYYMRKRANKKRITFREEFVKEAQFVMDLHNNTRRLRESDENLDTVSEDSAKVA